MGDLGEGMDLNLNLSPPSTPHLGLALGLGVGPTSPVSAASANEDEIFSHDGEGSIPGRVFTRPFEGSQRVRLNSDDDEDEIRRHRSRHRWRGQFRRESLSPFIILRAVDHTNNPTDSEFEQRNPHAETLKENPSTLKACSNQDGNDNNASNFECNICLEMSREPVVTSCGHLFCWGCLYQWLHVHSTSEECPVCKGEVTDTNITPIYGRGNSDRAGNETKMVDNGEKIIPPRPRANRIESLRQRFGRPISRRFMEAIRLNRRRETLNENRVAHGVARQDESSNAAEGVENLLGAAADQILNSFSLVHFHRQAANLQRSRSGEDRWQMRQVLARRSLLRPNTTTPNTRSLLDLHREGERERESIWGHLQLGRLHRASAASERLASTRERVTPMEGMVASGNSDMNERGFQGVVRSDNNRERPSISSTNAMIVTGGRSGDAVMEQDSGRSSSPQRRRHVPSCSLDSDGGLLNARKRRRLN